VGAEADLDGDAAFGSAPYIESYGILETRAFSWRLSDSRVSSLHPAGQWSSYVRAAAGGDLFGEAGNQAGVWRGGKMLGFQSLHPSGYAGCSVAAVGDG